jgi:hypothetical protein
MNVIFGKDNLDQIDDRYTALELETIHYKDGTAPVTNYAIVGPDDLTLVNLLAFKNRIPVHEALMKNYKDRNFAFCLQAIDKLIGNIDPFMDTFYAVLRQRIKDQIEDPTPGWTHIVDLSTKIVPK